MRKSTLLLVVMTLSLAIILPALQSGVGGGGQSNVGGGGGGTPGGSNGQVQYNNNGVFGGASGVTTDGTSLFITGTAVLNGNGSITASPPIGALNNSGWKTCWFSTTFCQGVAAFTEAHLNSGGGWLSLFSSNPANNATASTPDGNATVSLGTNGSVVAKLYDTATNCSSSASPAVCAAAPAGSVAIAAAATTETVNTTAVTANSQILLTRDDSLGTKLGVTCNTATVMGEMKVSARTGGTSFTITVQTAPATNPGCVSYSIVN